VLTYQKIIKRIFDFVVSVVGLFFLWPLILVCILIARWDTGLSGLFVQSRVGQFGNLVQVRKIRTMVQIDGVNSTVTVVGDRRITPVGAAMRRWKLDELPQLWNVFVGDMSFVGPRPDVPGYADQLKGENCKILQMKPGITGPATIKYRNEEELLSSVDDAKEFNDSVLYPDKVKINLDYMERWSLLGDIKYILITFGILSAPTSLTINSGFSRD